MTIGTWISPKKTLPKDNEFVRVWAKLAGKNYFGCARFYIAYPLNKSEISPIIKNHFKVILEDDHRVDFGHNDTELLSNVVEVYKWRELS